MGFIRVACVAPDVVVADVTHNSAMIVAALEKAARLGAAYVLFPELAVTGYSCGDLFYQRTLLVAAENSLVEIARVTRELNVVAIVGAPVSVLGRLYNCAAVLSEGRVAGLVPKQYLPNTGEFYEQRWFTAAASGLSLETSIGGVSVSVSPGLLFCDHTCHFTFGIEICEDLWAALPPSGFQALAGATAIFNPSASNELLGKAEYRRDLVRQQSARCLSAYVYASSGPGESSTDTVYSGHCLVAESGTVLSESERFSFDSSITLADVDIDRLVHDRHSNSSFSVASCLGSEFRRIGVGSPAGIPDGAKPLGVLRHNPARPFVPADPAQRDANCKEIFAIQSAGLAKRLRHVAISRVVVGVSGGLDSTLALLIAAHTFDRLGLDRKGIIAPTLPGYGTTARTKTNAQRLSELLGASSSTIPIADAVKQHFSDIGYDPADRGVTYENAQARERTQILMDLANKCGALVLGTGDLSESALGWCTFNGDQMSMYHVNVGVPKTLVRYVVDWCAGHLFKGDISSVLRDICATPITPELLPLGDDGSLQQRTEEIVGPYDLHDYFLYQIVRLGYGPEKVLYMAELAFAGEYTRAAILKWLEVFIKRFFSQQFKRSAMPDGPKVGSVALSPRADWRMPSDASAAVWLSELRRLAEAADAPEIRQLPVD